MQVDLKPHLDQTRTLDRKPPLDRNQGRTCTRVVHKRHLARTRILVALKLHLVLKVVRPAAVAMDHNQHLAQTLTLVLK